MKRSTNPTPAQVAASCEAQSLNEPEVHRAWLVIFADGAEVERRYQHAVSLSRVLSEHHGALAAVPMPSEENTQAMEPSK